MKRLALFALLTVRLGFAEPTPVPTWHLIFGGGDAPNRSLIVADENVQVTPEGISQIRILEQFENHPQNVDFYVFTLEYNTKTTQMRSLKVYRILRDGKVEYEQKPSPWMAVPNNWMRVGYNICANPRYYEENKATSPVIGKFVRPVDIVELNRRMLWKAGKGGVPDSSK